MLAEAQESSLVTTMVVFEFSLGTVELWEVALVPLWEELVWARAAEARRGRAMVENFIMRGGERVSE